MTSPANNDAALSMRRRPHMRRVIPELEAVRQAHDVTIAAAFAFEDTLLAAAEAGASLREIGEYANASASTVLRAIRRAEERRRKRRSEGKE